MWRVIVQVKGDQDQKGRDLEIPTDVPAWQLGRMLARALEWDEDPKHQHFSYTLEAELLDLSPEFRYKRVMLRDSDTLAKLGVWNGATLFLKRQMASYIPAHFVADSGQSYPLMAPEMRIGRDLSDETVIGDLVNLKNEPQGRSVSRHHAFIRFKDTAWTLIITKESKYPSFLDNQPLQAEQPYPLNHGSRVQLGSVTLQFCLDQSNSRSESSRS